VSGAGGRLGSVASPVRGDIFVATGTATVCLYFHLRGALTRFKADLHASRFVWAKGRIIFDRQLWTGLRQVQSRSPAEEESSSALGLLPGRGNEPGRLLGEALAACCGMGPGMLWRH
jgi:hypothetical protein